MAWVFRSLAVSVPVVLGLCLLAVPAAAQDDTPAECLIDTGEQASAEGDVAAVEQAVACGREVEVADLRDEFGTVTALPSGELVARTAVEPIHAVDESGEWAPIDTTLEIAADGSVRPVNITEEIAFSPGGAAPLVTVDYGTEGSFALAWPEALPEPVLEGSQAIYHEVHAGVDLVVEVNAQGFRYDLVVADAEAAANPELEAIAFDIAATGVEVAASETGAIEVSVAGQAEMVSGQALMWETSAISDGTETVPPLHEMTDTSEEPDQEVAPVTVALESEDLVLRPDLELLRGADTRYPVVIDPQWDGGIQDNRWGLVNTKYPDQAFYRGKNASGDYFMSNTGTYGNAGAGRVCDNWSGLTCTSSEYRMRSFFRMDTDTVAQNDYRIPSRAVFKIVQRHSASCSNGTARIWLTGGYNANDTWNTQPSWNESVTITSANNGAQCGGSAYVAFNVTAMMQKAKDGEWANLTLGLRAADESPSPDLEQWNRFDADTAVLEITYDVRPYSVKYAKTNGIDCTSVAADAPWINDRTPELSAQYGSQDSKINYEVRVRSSAPVDQIIYEYTSGDVTADARYSKVVPSAEALGDGLYHWHARSISTSNSAITSNWTAACRIKVDGTKPATPTVTPGSEGPYEVGGTLALNLSATDPTVNGISSGIDHFEYSWQSETYNNELAATGTAAITRTLSAGRHVLYVRAVDAAGNESEGRVYTFFAGRDILATPMATWRFEGDAVDDTRHGNDLTLADGSAITYTTDRDGRADAALALDGQTCLSVQNPVMRTDAAYSLTAWVRMDAVDGATERPLAQLNGAHSAFQVWYSAEDDLWYFSVLDQDMNWNSVGATPTVALGEWEHLAAVYDPDKQVIRLYLGGALVVEEAISFTPWNANEVFSLGCILTDGAPLHHVSGAIDQVGLWQGVLSQAEIESAMTDLPTASVQADWTFRNDGTDESGYGRNLNTDGVTVGPDPFQRPSGAVELDGVTCLEYPEPVIGTDRSFTVAAWAKLDTVADHATIASITGEQTTSMRLRYSTSVGKWVFMVTDQDSNEATWPQVQSIEAVEAGRWYQLTGVFDAPAQELRFYVDGELQGTRTGVTSVWAGTGSTLVGCAGQEVDGDRWEHFTGSLHGVSLWRGAIDEAQVAGFMATPPATIAAWWNFDNFSSDPAISPTPEADLSGGGHDLSFTEPVVFDFMGYNSELDNALAVNGTAHARTTGPVIATDESFTIATWVRVDDLTSDGVAMSMTGDSRSVITVKYSAANGTWEFAAPSESTDGSWHIAGTEAAPTGANNGYTLLVGVFDLPSNELRLYVDGALAATATDVVLPAATGPVVIGAEGNADGTIRDGLTGAVDDTIVWQGALACEAVAALYDPNLHEEVC